MFTKSTHLTKKILLAVLVLAIGLAALPLTSAYAAGMNDEGTPPGNSQPSNERLEKVWARELKLYQVEGDRLSKADEIVTRVQTLIAKANGKGWDTSAIQSALSAFTAAVTNARTVHANGEGIVSSHAGFDANGKVTDHAQAVQTVKALGKVLKDTRTAMNGTGAALREAVKDFIQTHKPTTNP